MEILKLFTICFQRRLPRICCMWERVNQSIEFNIQFASSSNQGFIRHYSRITTARKCSRKKAWADTQCSSQPLALLQTFWDAIYSRRFLKTLGQNDKLFMMRNFSTNHIVLNPIQICIHAFIVTCHILFRCYQSRLLKKCFYIGKDK